MTANQGVYCSVSRNGTNVNPIHPSPPTRCRGGGGDVQLDKVIELVQVGYVSFSLAYY